MPHTELVYQPMLEVMKLLRASGYKTYLVTGGGEDFVWPRRRSSMKKDWKRVFAFELA